ncbi:Hsp20/alpha crystallin family protein [Paracoccus onubensis]|uniref:Hsp20/alpha crystallin family protein n=1 Tax=Paracoccus onubensis TaxID=1675788 RepID=UPI00272F896C|nr:Hsp20/alpha crystallin family protein [Paracoccus onubensis]MDP0928476.1 Hsp20/alpha crystallin family protein [Paracoccus onubensis]
MSVRDLIPWGRSRNNQALSSWQDESSDPFVTFHREFDRLFDNLWRSFDSHLPAVGMQGKLAGQAWPNVEVSESDNEIRVTADLPGMEEKDVELLLDNGALTLRGEKRSSCEDQERQFSERYYGRFQRIIPLPVEIDQDKVDARFSNGVLSVILPKSETAKSQVKRIEINR